MGVVRVTVIGGCQLCSPHLIDTSDERQQTQREVAMWTGARRRARCGRSAVAGVTKDGSEGTGGRRRGGGGRQGGRWQATRGSATRPRS
jgi:hypothetical protein